MLRVEPDAGTVVRLTDPLSPTDGGRGITGIAFGWCRAAAGMPWVRLLFLARSRAAGAPESGMYTLDPETAGQTPAPLALNAGSDPVGITFDSLDGATLVSSSAGTGPLRNVLLTESDSSFAINEEPCGDDPCGGALGDVVTDYLPDYDTSVPYPLVYERGADDRVLARGIYGAPTEVVFQASWLVAATGIAGFEPAGRSGYLAVLNGGWYVDPSTLLLAGSDEGGATPGIYSVAALTPVAGEASPETGAARLAVFPNPASGRVAVRASLAAAGPVRVAVYDALGREVAVAFDGALSAGEREMVVETGAWPAGVYVVRMTAGAETVSARLVVAR